MSVWCSYVVDRLSWKTTRAELLLRLGRYEEAREGKSDYDS